MVCSCWEIGGSTSWGRGQSGYYLTWTGGASIPGIINNVQWSDYWNVNMRITKGFQFGRMNVQLYADLTNLFNYRYMTTYGFVTTADYNDYFQSLHLEAFAPEVDTKVGYVNIPEVIIPELTGKMAWLFNQSLHTERWPQCSPFRIRKRVRSTMPPMPGNTISM